jgi:hypothetical protein
MIFKKISRIFSKSEEIRETVPYHLAEQIIREAMRRGTRSINIKCWPKETFFAGKNNFADLVEEEPDSPIRFRQRNYVLGISLRGNEKDKPYISLPAGLFLPLLNILASQKIEYKGKKCFALYSETSSQKTIDKYLDLTLYWEDDSSISIDFEEIK